MDMTTFETPIFLIKDKEVKWEIAYEIYPIQAEHGQAIIKLLEKDELFSGISLDCRCYWGKVTHILLKAELYWVDLTSLPVTLEKRIDDTVEDYMAANGGYASIRA